MQRQLYRSLLRATARGGRSDVIPWPYACTPSNIGVPPIDASDVRQLLREIVVNEQHADGFEVLRNVNALSRALYPPSAESDLSDVPAFVFPSQVLVPGERAEWIFFEPRYRALVHEALARDKPFVHFASTSASTAGTSAFKSC